MSGPTRREWADAFARQARSDWEVFRKLAAMSELSPCHRLHYLQMACEKIAKAYRWRDTSTAEHALQNEHVAFSRFIQQLLGSPAIRQDFEGRQVQLAHVVRLCRKLAREVEKLAPAVDRDRSPENSEYPWAAGESVIVPCDYSYPSLSLLEQPKGLTFLKLMNRAIHGYHTLRVY